MSTNGNGNGNGHDEQVTLTADDLILMLSQTRTRGGYADTLDTIANSGELYCIVSDLPEYVGKEPQAIITSLNGNYGKKKAERNWPRMKFLKRKVEGDKVQVIAVNLDLLEEAKVNAAA